MIETDRTKARATRAKASRATVHERVVAAARRCLARDGLRGTTVDDVAVDAGVSRATLYRAFPGGRETILAALVDVELARLLAAIRDAMAPAQGLAGALTEGLHAGASWLTSHEVLERLMFDEPAALLTHLEFEQMDRTLEVLRTALAPLLEPYLEQGLAERVGEWVVRLAVSYLLFPSDEVDLTVRGDVARLVERYVVPGVEALSTEVCGDETVSTELS